MGNADDMTEFLRSHSRALLAYGYALTSDRASAEDLVQESLARTFERWDRLREDQSPEYYVRTIMYRLYVSRWRKFGRRERQLDTAPLRFTVVPDTTAHTDDHTDLMRLIAALPPRERAVVALFYFEDMSTEAIATVLEIAPITVRGLLLRARQHLRTALTDGGATS